MIKRSVHMLINKQNICDHLLIIKCMLCVNVQLFSIKGKDIIIAMRGNYWRATTFFRTPPRHRKHSFTAPPEIIKG